MTLPNTDADFDVVTLAVSAWCLLYGFQINYRVMVAGDDYRDPTWRHRELVAFVVLGVCQVLGTVSTMVDPWTTSFRERYWLYAIQMAVGLGILLVVPWSFVLRDRWNRTFCCVFAWGMIAGGALLAPLDPGTFHVYEAVEVALVSLYSAVGTALLVAGCLRLLSEIVYGARLLYGASLSCIGALLLMTIPQILQSLLDGVTPVMARGPIITDLLLKGLALTITAHCATLAILRTIMGTGRKIVPAD